MKLSNNLLLTIFISFIVFIGVFFASAISWMKLSPGQNPGDSFTCDQHIDVNQAKKDALRYDYKKDYLWRTTFQKSYSRGTFPFITVCVDTIVKPQLMSYNR